MNPWTQLQVASIANTVAAKVIDHHDIPLKGAVAVEIALPPQVIVGTICSSEEHSSDILTSGDRFSKEDIERITLFVSRLVECGQSFVTRTRDGSVMWTIGDPADEPNPSEF